MYCQILTRGKFLILTIVLLWTLLILSGCGGGPSPAPPVLNEIVYRAYCVGVGDYMYFPPFPADDGHGNTDLPGPPYDVKRMCYTLSKCRFGPSNTEFSEIWYTTDLAATKSNILQGIASVFSEADYNDVSYFYFTGHGIWDEITLTSYLCPTEIDYYSSLTSFISVNELETALSAIPGTKVVFLDSCHSEEELESFNDEVINAFSLAEYKGLLTTNEYKILTSYEVINAFSLAEYKGLLTTNEYKILTSCHYYQECMELAPKTPGDFDPFGVFTMALCTGCGCYGSYPADTNLDTGVSLQEAYLCIRNWVIELNAQLPDISITQDVQVYPYNSTFTIAEY